MYKTLGVVLLLALFAQSTIADELSEKRLDNWHQWRGPLATGEAPRATPPIKWSETENVKWKVRIPGEGSSTPIVWGDRVYVLAAEPTNRKAETPPEPHDDAKTLPPDHYYRFLVLCLDRQTGETIWQRTACEAVPHEGRHPSHSYAAGSPMTDGQFLYASFGSRGVYCYDLDGKLKWQRDLGDMRTRYGWGEASSPVVHGDSVVVNWDHEDDSFIAVLDAQTGETKWQAERDEPTSWATPLPVDYNGRTQLITCGTNRVRSYDLKTGEIVWQSDGLTVNAIPSPLRLGDMVICMSGYRGYKAYAIPLDATGDITDAGRSRWSHFRGTPYVPSPLLYQGLLYFTRANSGILSCLDAKTGKPLYEGQRLDDARNLYSSPVAAAGHVFITDRAGTTTVVKYGPKFEVAAVNKLDDPIDATPALAGKQIFLRGRQFLYCIEED